MISLTLANPYTVSMPTSTHQQALALGINLGVSRLGAVANNVLSPIFWDENHIALWMGAIICAASFMCGVGLASIDKIAEKTLKAKNVNYVEPEVEVCLLLFALLLMSGVRYPPAGPTGFEEQCSGCLSTCALK